MVVLSYIIPFLAVLASVSSSPIEIVENFLSKRQNIPNNQRPVPLGRNTAQLLQKPLEKGGILELTTLWRVNTDLLLPNGQVDETQHANILLLPKNSNGDPDWENNNNLIIRVHNSETRPIRVMGRRNTNLVNVRDATWQSPDLSSWQITPQYFYKPQSQHRWQKIRITIRYVLVPATGSKPEERYYEIRFWSGDSKCRQFKYEFPPNPASVPGSGLSHWLSYGSPNEGMMSFEIQYNYAADSSANIKCSRAPPSS